MVNVTREILTYPISAAQVNEELEHFVHFFLDRGYEHCDVIFGFAWGNQYYPTNAGWNPIRMPIDVLIDEVRRVERSGWGELGSDNLFISIPGVPLEFRFCDDSDIHIAFEDPCETTEHFYQRWKSRGFSPAEWEKLEDRRTGKRLRMN